MPNKNSFPIKLENIFEPEHLGIYDQKQLLVGWRAKQGKG